MFFTQSTRHFNFCEYQDLRDRFIRLKDCLWDDYQGTELVCINNELLSVAIDILHIDELALSDLEKAKILTGLLLELQAYIKGVLISFAQSMGIINYLSTFWVSLPSSKLEIDMTNNLNDVIGINSSNAMDESSKCEAWSYLAKYREGEFAKADIWRNITPSA